MVINIKSSEGESTKILRDALAKVEANGGGSVRLLPGVHLTGSLRLPSGLRLEVCEGAVLKALPDLEAMDAIKSPIYSRMDVVPWKTFLYAIGARDLVVFGTGTIDGSGDAKCFRDGIENSPNRPYGVHFINSEKIKVRDVFFTNAGFWMQRYFACREVQISNIRVFNHSNKNNDGIDIDSCAGVVVENCRVDSSDDAICIKSEGFNPAKNIQVRDCVISTHASAFKLGSGSIGGFEDIFAERLQIVPSKAIPMHHPLGLRGGLSGIDLSSVDGGKMARVEIEEVYMEGLQNPIFLRLGKRGSRSVALQGYGNGEDLRQGVAAGQHDHESRVGHLSDVCLRRIRGHDLGPYPIILCGLPDFAIHNITLEDIELSFSRPGRAVDIVPPKEWQDDGYPMPPMFGTALPAYGLFTRGVRNLKTTNVFFDAAPGDPRPEIVHI